MALAVAPDTSLFSRDRDDSDSESDRHGGPLTNWDSESESAEPEPHVLHPFDLHLMLRCASALVHTLLRQVPSVLGLHHHDDDSTVAPGGSESKSCPPHCQWVSRAHLKDLLRVGPGRADTAGGTAVTAAVTVAAAPECHPLLVSLAKMPTHIQARRSLRHSPKLLYIYIVPYYYSHHVLSGFSPFLSPAVCLGPTHWQTRSHCESV